ncbi:MAG: type II secretion system F family protein [Desulfobacter sp.]|nr:MAG: type II secretion system F family protein [Desulfobacter sp.]
MKYTYKAINEIGNEITGELQAGSKDEAFEILSARGYIPESVREKGASALNDSDFASKIEDALTPVKPRDLILFTKQFKTLIQAGVAMMDILSTMEEQTENKRLKRVIGVIRADIREGANLYIAFSKHDTVFSELYCNMLQAGEASGSLPDVLERLIYILDHEHKIKSDIKSAMRYPMMVVFCLGIAFFVLLTFVIPKFITIFQKAGLELPLPTKICMNLYQAIEAYWHVGIVGMVLGGIGLYYALFKTDQGRVFKDTAFLKTPLIGPVVLKAAMSRFASIFSILQMSGVTVLESMEVLGKTINNAAITKEFEKITELLTEGRGISQPLKRSKYFPPMVINMVAIGEESGNLDDMLAEISVHYDAEVEYSTKAMSEAIGPLLIVGLAGVVGFFAMAIFLPMWDLTKMV